MIDIVFCHLLNDFSGSPKVLNETINVLAEKWSNTKLFIGSSGDGVLSTCGIPIRRYWYVRSSYKILTFFTYFFSQILLFMMLLFDRSIDKNAVIYINTLLPFGAALYGKITGRKVIYHVHEISISPMPLRKFLIKIVELTSSINIYVSKVHMQLLPISGIPGKYVHNVLDEKFLNAALNSKYHPTHEGFFNILMIASLRDYKGIPEFLILVNSLSSRDEIHFDLLLNEDQSTIDQYFIGKKIPSCLNVHSKSSSTTIFYKKASLVLNLSRIDLWQETFGLTILEALAFGVPVIVPSVGGPVELISEGVEGFLLDSRNQALLYEKVFLLLNNFQLCMTMSRAARQRAQNFSRKKFSTVLSETILEIKNL